MSTFNHSSRTNNVIKTSAIGTVCHLINTVMGFVYRTIFLHYLTSSYLGLNGLFTNILQVLSFAELGISTAISYRFYEPISRNDVHKVGQLMGFFKRVYAIIALVILVVGGACFPFLKYLIKDTAEVPSDINLYLIFGLYLLQTLSSYTFVYKQTILSADQRQYVLSFVNTVTSLIRYVLQIVVLALYRNYTLTLIVNISYTILMNILVSAWVARQYKDVFAVKEVLPKEERTQIYDDTKATLCHKVGGTVLNSTDNILISSFVGLQITGLYSNYALIISSLNQILVQLFGSFTSTLGNAAIEQSQDQKYNSYRRLLFLNFWMASICTICLYNLFDAFIAVWVGESMILDHMTVIMLCIQFFMVTSRYISMSYTNGCGLFVRDKIRPIIEAAINLVVSVIMVQFFGLPGIFMGTIASNLCTVFWREPYLLYKYEFKKSMRQYWSYYAIFTIITVLTAGGFGKVLLPILHPERNFLMWMITALCVFAASNLILCLLFVRNEDFDFYVQYAKKKVLKR